VLAIFVGIMWLAVTPALHRAHGLHAHLFRQYRRRRSSAVAAGTQGGSQSRLGPALSAGSRSAAVESLVGFLVTRVCSLCIRRRSGLDAFLYLLGSSAEHSAVLYTVFSCFSFILALRSGFSSPETSGAAHTYAWSNIAFAIRHGRF